MSIPAGMSGAWLDGRLQADRTKVVFEIVLGTFHAWGARKSAIHPLRRQDHYVLMELSGFVVDSGEGITDGTVLRKERKSDHGQ